MGGVFETGQQQQQLCLKGLLVTAVCNTLVIMSLFKDFGTTAAIAVTH